jgi:monoamine oxidase
MARTLSFKILSRWLVTDSTETDILASPSRRQFLNKTVPAGLAAATFATPACTTLDRWVLGDSNRLENEVLVLGAGLAGLTAAYQLKKNHIGYRVYEASARLGGRVQTLNFFNSDRQFAELGGEFFDETHHELAQLCQELGLKAQDISYELKTDRALYWLDGKVVGEKEFRKKLKPLAVKFAQIRAELIAEIPGEIKIEALLNSLQAKALDAQSLAQVMTPFRGKVVDGVLDSFENLCRSEWGVETSEINLLQFIVRLLFEEKSLVASASKMYRVEGGNGRAIQVLGERVQGILPGFTLKLEYMLTEIKIKSGGYALTFKTPTGKDTVWARHVICTLPWSVLKDVKGIDELDLPAMQSASIQNTVYAGHGKVIASFKDAVWRHRKAGVPPFQGVFRGQLFGQDYWDSGRGQSGSHGILTSQRSIGKEGLATDVASSQLAKDLQHFFKDFGTTENLQIADWQQRPFARGSRMHHGPGKYLRHLEMLSQASSPATFYFAGEHVSFRDAGTMNGAIETGIAAAARAMKGTFSKSTTA